MAELSTNTIETIRKVVKAELEVQTKNRKSDTKTAFQKTESVLYVYPNLDAVIKSKRTQIDEVKQVGVPCKDKSIVEFSEHGGTVSGLVLPEDSVDSIVQGICGQIAQIESAKNTIDKALEHIATDKWYKIIECKYFNGMTVDQMEIELGASRPTIITNKNRLVRRLATWLFPQDVVKEILE